MSTRLDLAYERAIKLGDESKAFLGDSEHLSVLGNDLTKCRAERVMATHGLISLGQHAYTQR